MWIQLNNRDLYSFGITNILTKNFENPTSFVIVGRIVLPTPQLLIQFELTPKKQPPNIFQHLYVEFPPPNIFAFNKYRKAESIS